jgi:quercetin dioxygenase-like cupin family protein
MAGMLIALEELPWETWDDPGMADRSGVRGKLVFSGRRTPTGAMSVGLAEIGPGGVLPLHHHAPAEVYHVFEGQGRAEVEGEAHELRPGRLLFIPANAKHRTTNTGRAPLR